LEEIGAHRARVAWPGDIRAGIERKTVLIAGSYGGETLKLVKKTARLDRSKCTDCGTCERLCPVLCIRTTINGSTKTTLIEQDNCLACTICSARCPENAITLISRDQPFEVGIYVDEVTDQIREICQQAHMYPDQVVCYCQRIQAKEIVAAILGGARTPEQVSQKTGARTGCGVLCITGIMRTLRAAGVDLGTAPGWQWYDLATTIWNIPAESLKKYPTYKIEDDRRTIDTMFPGGETR